MYFLDFHDDEMDDTQVLQADALQNEIMHYKTIKMKREEKQKCNVLQWWKDNKNHYPCLFRTALTLLHITATSVPAERIFS